jgi:hypothetical protein
MYVYGTKYKCAIYIHGTSPTVRGSDWTEALTSPDWTEWTGDISVQSVTLVLIFSTNSTSTSVGS